MNVSFTDEQEALQDMANALAVRIGPQTSRDLDEIDDTKAWSLLGDAGLLGLRVPEAAGGVQASGVEVMTVAEALGRRVCPVPYLGCAVLATELLSVAGAAPGLLESLVSGERRVTVALDRSLSRLAQLGEEGAVAWDAAGAEAALVLGPDGALVAVRPGERRLGGADLTRSLVPVPPDAPEVELGEGLGLPVGTAALEGWEALALAALSADLVGGMDGTLARAVAYSQEREQFGVRIGSFQAIQHLCAEAYVLLEGARSATWYAAWSIDRRPATEALLAARTAKAYAAESAITVAETSIQVHGGVAITWEYLPHVFLRRAWLSRATLGDEGVQLRQIAQARALGPS
jgi:alkylation response protein AidB-like acyl-CoA dehydrogenase